jgi:signal transduction histidine kinase
LDDLPARKPNLPASRGESQTYVKTRACSQFAQNLLRKFVQKQSGTAKKVLALVTLEKHNTCAAPSRLAGLHVRAFEKIQIRKLMNESNPDPNEVGRLRTIVAEYEQKMTDAAALVAHVRHEINNPLAALLGQAQLLLRQQDLSEKSRRRAETIEQQAKRIQEIVGQLREVQTPPSTLNKSE